MCGNYTGFDIDAFNMASSLTITIASLIGNSIVFYILTRPEFLKQTLFRYMLIATISDAINSITIWPTNYPYDFLVFKVLISCKLFNFLVNISNSISPFMNVIGSIDTFLLVKYPTKFKFRKKFKFQIFVTFILLFFLSIVNIPNYYYAVLISDECVYETEVIEFYVTVMVTFVEVILPFTLVVIFSILTYFNLVERKKLAHHDNFSKEKRFLKVVNGMKFENSFNLSK